MSPGFGAAILLPVPGINAPTPSYWMISPYRDQTRLATALRNSTVAQTFVAEQGVRLGLRESDRPPAGLERQTRYGSTIVGGDAGKRFEAQPMTTLAAAVRPDQPAPLHQAGGVPFRPLWEVSRLILREAGI